MRIGIGYDIHKLIEGKNLVIGSVKIPYSKGFIAHSDGDVLIHAIIDSILGALAKGDIGTLFPDNDEKYKNIDSTILLKEVVEILKNENYKIINLDCNIIAQAPKMAPYINNMRENLASILNIKKEDISIKAKTNEGLDSVGQNEAIATQCVCLIEKIN